MISTDQARKYLELVHQLKRECAFYDVHAHPFEIFYDDIEYSRHPADERVYTADGTDFAPPAVSDIMTDADTRSRSVLRLFNRSAGKTRLGDAYRHTGARVFEQHGGLSGIDHMLLLPVAPPDGSGEMRMAEISEMFNGSGRFLTALSIPNRVDTGDIGAYLTDRSARFDCRAVKVHPNITGIDPASPAGRERIEAILDACGACGLPLVIHGGMSPVLGEKPAATYGVLDNLARIDWGGAAAPVIIAHAGFYGYGYDRIDGGLLSVLDGLLMRHDRLRVDLSGLNVGVISLILDNVDAQRILFGSDMLYEDQWQMVVRTMCAIEQSGLPLEETFIRLAGENPAAVFKRKPINDQTTE